MVRAIEELPIEAEDSVVGSNPEVTTSQEAMDRTAMAPPISSQRRNTGVQVSAMVRSLPIWMRLILPLSEFQSFNRRACLQQARNLMNFSVLLMMQSSSLTTKNPTLQHLPPINPNANLPPTRLEKCQATWSKNVHSKLTRLQWRYLAAQESGTRSKRC